MADNSNNILEAFQEREQYFAVNSQPLISFLASAKMVLGDNLHLTADDLVSFLKARFDESGLDMPITIEVINDTTDISDEVEVAQVDFDMAPSEWDRWGVFLSWYIPNEEFYIRVGGYSEETIDSEEV